MAQIHVTNWLRNLVSDAPLNAAGGTVGEALAVLLAGQPHVHSDAYLPPIYAVRFT